MIRVFPRRTKWTPTDKLAFVGLPPLFRPPEQSVRISVVFTWDLAIGQRLKTAWEAHYNDVQIGGPAFEDEGGDFVPGRFIKDGVTITSRGCIRRCPWCFVPDREGLVRELEIKDGHIVQDNNLLACSRGHIEKVFEMLQRQKRAITFSGGLDTRLLRDWHQPLFDSVGIKEMWFACDTWAALRPLEKAAEMFANVPQYKKRCYTMIGFDENETLAQAEERLKTVFKMGFDPFCQLYQSNEKREYPKEWKALSRLWSRQAAYKSQGI